MTETLLAGLADPTLDSQRVFRAALHALSRPGRTVDLPDVLPDGAPAPLMPATAALALALFDYETPVWLDPEADRPAARDWLRFHCGCPLVADKGQARFAILAGPLDALDGFAAGTDAYPDHSATLLVQVAGLSDGPAHRLTGPGIELEEIISIKGLPADFAALWERNRGLFPRGIDLFLADGARLIGLPRTTRVEPKEA